jgi:hypothetical protein
MSQYASPLPLSLDPLMAEAKRRTWRRRLLLVAPVLVIGVAVGAALLLTSGGGASSAGPSGREVKVATFAVSSVNPSTLLAGTYVTVVSPVSLSRQRLADEALFNVTAQFSLVKRAHGPRLCSFSKRIERSVMFPDANGRTVRVEVYGSKSPSRVTRVCRAFETFSLSYVRHPPPAGWVPPKPPAP